MLDALTSAGGRSAPPGAILFGEDIAPTRFLATDWSAGGGIALSKGSSASHVAMLARSRGVPMVVGLGNAAKDVAGLALLDAEHGGIVLRPDRRRHRRISANPSTRLWRASPPRRRPRHEAGGDRRTACRCACWSTSPIRPMSTASTSRAATASA